MSYRLPNGATMDLASTYGTSKTITAITNANPAVATAAGHGFSDGDYIELSSGWTGLNGRIVRVANSDTDSFELEDIDTTDTDRYPVGTGIGSAREITAWMQIAQITDVATSGGDQQFYTFGFLEESDDRQLPTTRSPLTMTLTVADDPAQSFFAVAQVADERRTPNGVRLNLPNGDKILYNCYVSLSETPALARNNLMTRTIALALAGRPVRYSAV